MRVSVVIPVYNLENYLAEALDSVLTQTWKNVEIIVVDDGSKDSSPQIIEEYARRFSKKIKTIWQPNRGAGAARNRGIEAAAGEWIAFLDGDDTWKPERLEKQMRLIEQDPVCNLVCSAAEILGEKTMLNETIPAGKDLKLDLLLHGCFIILSSVLMKKELFAIARFNEKLEGAQDLDLFLRLADSCHLRHVGQPLVHYRIRPGAISDLRGTQYLQLHHHHQLLKAEMKKMRNETPARFLPLKDELQRLSRRLAREAAYASLFSARSTVFQRLRLCRISLIEQPGNLKNTRYLCQALLPPAWNHFFKAKLKRARKAKTT